MVYTCKYKSPLGDILLAADFLVNAGENGYSKKSIENFCKKIFRTATGTHLLKSMYLEKM